jgi:putative component of membrane protein insertase Oxa1/YidC/SpoIIIJ protein YidD
MDAATFTLNQEFNARSGAKTPSFSSRIALAGISFYRKNLSQHKGFSCACGAMGCPTCSTMGLRLFRRFSPTDAFALQQKYFEKCREMKAIFDIARSNPPEIAVTMIQDQFGKTPLQSSILVDRALQYGRPAEKDENGEPKKKRSRGRSGSVFDGCGNINPVFVPLDCAPGPCDGGHHHAGACDAPGDCHVGSCDLT